jgi:DnaA family protein|tara:strand:+ start:481 stop:1146 length:666 start_codon:yes stop_codon:yes gene_type:complete
MIQKTLNLSLNYKILFDDIKSLSFCDEVRDKSDDFLSSDNHCLILKGDELVNSYIFQAIYNDLEKNSKCIFISMKDNKSEVLKDLDNFSHIFIDSFNECFENKISEIDLFNLYNSSKDNSSKLILRENSLTQKNILLPDLKSRINSNIELVMPKLTDKDKKHIIEIELIKRGLSIKEKNLDFIMNHSSRNLETLQTLVNKLDKLTMERKKNISIPLIKELI